MNDFAVIQTFFLVNGICNGILPFSVDVQRNMYSYTSIGFFLYKSGCTVPLDRQEQ